MACTMKSAVAQRSGLLQKQSSPRLRARTMVCPRALSDVNLVVGGATIGALVLGRAVLPIHQKFLAKAGMPKQNGVPHLAAGDMRSEEISLATKTNDPAGFTLVHVFAWGALGHAAAYYLLATSSLGLDRNPF